MDRGFRLLLRIALVLLILAGVGLVVYAVVSDGPPGWASDRGRAEGPPAPLRSPVAEIEPPQPAPPSPAPLPAEERSRPASPTARGEGREGQLELVGFRSVLRDEQAGHEEATVEGARALPKETLYEVSLPVVNLLMPSQDRPQVDTQIHNVHITAQHAQVYKDRSGFRLFQDVLARGEDFEIATPSVSYSAKERTLTSQDPVRIQRDRTDERGSRAPAMVIIGEGLFVDVTVRNMTILKNVEARLCQVSQDFLSTKPELDAETAKSTTDVVITCAGQMNYEHPARRVVFHDTVRAVSGDKTLSCDTLTVLLGETEGTDSLQVQKVVASGNAELLYAGQIARGDTLTWHSVTQMGALSGQPAVLSTPEFELAGKDLTLYHVSERFQCEGPGTLYWKAAETRSQAPKPDAPQGMWDLGPLSLTSDAPLSVKWQNGMKYEKGERLAVFNGAVTASQGGSRLDCERLVITFLPGVSRIATVQGDGNVRVRGEANSDSRDVLCERLLWDAARQTVELTAARGGTVNVTSGRNVIASERVALDSPAATLECPAPGEVTVAPRPTKPGADGEPPAVPLSVKWRKAMRFSERPAPRANFQGEVVAVRGDQQISGESLDLEFDSNMNALKIVARGGVVIDVRSARPEPETPAASPEEAVEAAGSALPGIAGVKGDDWRLQADEVTILPPQDVLVSETPGTLTVSNAGVTTGTISWHKSMRVAVREGSALFQGQTRADVSGAELRSETLKLDFDQDRKLRHIWAEGSVFFVSRREDGWELRSDSAEAVFGADSVLRQIIARGNVEVHDPAYTLTAQVLTLYTAQDGEKGRPAVIERAVAERNVHVRYRKEEELEAGGDRLEWTRQTDIFILTGAPEAYWRYGDLAARSPKMLLDRATGRMHLPPASRPIRTEVTTGPL